MSVTVFRQLDLFDDWWVKYEEGERWVPVDLDIPEEHVEAHLKDPVNHEDYPANRIFQTHLPHNGYGPPMTYVHSIRFPDGRVWDSTHKKFFHEVVLKRQQDARRQ